MRTFCFVSHKGGVGKTTLAAALTASAADLGLRAGVLDLDASTQGLSDFVALRLDKGLPAPELLPPPLWPRTRTPSSRDASAAIREATDMARAKGVDLLLIDLEAVSHALWLKAAACLAADTVITPVSDSPLDLRAVLTGAGRGELAEFVDAAGQHRPDWVVVRNRTAHLRTRLSEDLAARMAAGEGRGGYRLLDGLKDRVAYREMFETGRSPLDPRATGRLSMSMLSARSEMRRLASDLLAAPRIRLLSVA